MKTVLSYFLKYIKSIFALIIILFVQVKFEIMLPDYTSKIVNVGIQQGGIESSVPKIIDEQTYAMMLSLSDTKNKNKIANSYELWNPKSDEKEQLNIKEKNENSRLITEKYYSKSYYLLKDKVNQYDIEDEMSDSLTRLLSYTSSQSKTGDENLVGVRNLKDSPGFAKKQIGIKMVGEIYKRNGIDMKGIQMKYLYKTGFTMVVMALLAGAVSILVSFNSSRVSAGVARLLRKDLFSKVLSFSGYEMNKFTNSSLIARSTNDVSQIQQSSSMALKFLFYGPMMAIGAITQILKLNVSMLWTIFLSVIIIVISIVTIMYIVLPKFRLVQKIVDKLNLISTELVSGIEVSRVFGAEKHEEERFDEVNKNLTKTNLFTNRIMFLLQPVMMLVMNLTTVLIVIVGSGYVDSGNLQVGSMMAFIQYSMQIIMAFLFMSMMSIIIPRAMVSANRIGEVLESDVVIKDGGEENNLGEGAELVFNNVGFKYEGAKENILEDISFKADKGEVVAIIGPTGSGKSTLVNLVTRFLDVSVGSITLNGINIKNIPLKILREKVTVISQKPVIFSGTIASNIEYARGIPRYKNMKKAAEISQSIEFILSKEGEFDSEVSQGGSNLSGGQRQRLSIARAISKDADVIIFDDSFSALDASTDRKLRDSIKKNLDNKTIIIIAQRVNTIIDADRIIVLEDGKIQGEGSHQELLETCDTYMDIARSQMTEEEIRNGKKK